MVRDGWIDGLKLTKGRAAIATGAAAATTYQSYLARKKPSGGRPLIVKKNGTDWLTCLTDFLPYWLLLLCACRNGWKGKAKNWERERKKKKVLTSDESSFFPLFFASSHFMHAAAAAAAVCCCCHHWGANSHFLKLLNWKGCCVLLACLPRACAFFFFFFVFSQCIWYVTYMLHTEGSARPALSQVCSLTIRRLVNIV